MKPIPSLEAMGLTRLEALAYSYLVANPATTGYKVSKGIGKPTANVYRALESLERKGAVTNDRASPPLFRAVAPDELFDRLEREFLDRREIAARALKSLAVETDADQDGVFALKTVEQVMGRARVMLTAARRVAVLDASSQMLAEFADAMDDARARGARVITLVRGAADGGEQDDVIIDTANPAPEASALRLVLDAREALIASIARPANSVRDAMWTRSALFARTLHEAIANEAFFIRVEQGLRDGLSVDELEGTYEWCRAIRALTRA
jgi:sugar-specific transcriptional regulator TrmB